MYFKYVNIFLFLICFLQVANAARFTDEQLREIYDGAKALSLRRSQLLKLDVSKNFKGRVNRYEVRYYLYEDEKYEKYQLTLESMQKITEKLPQIDADITFEEYEKIMNRVELGEDISFYDSKAIL
ncbi:uncharacterized protein LOC126837079 [Adelges cooleyi]|uniref:uncharacterized protein LOC126837079 n=1 Tax=Adelges cooleyi TaxID=133065 RepID=UPI00218010F7|nr:uncharacterized protein LOC126837079 [Adelges cooleyi]XP_050426793.1 uncharacterized protein LOC126837079 [Adelges cooleyi]